MVTYATDTSKWEDWQKDYRLGLILIMPPREVSRLIDPLRSRYDPKAFRSCPTHISISDPLRLEMTQELDEEIAGILREQGDNQQAVAFDIEARSLARLD